MKQAWNVGVPSPVSWIWLTTGTGFALLTLLRSRDVVANGIETQNIWALGDVLIGATVAALLLVVARLTYASAPRGARRWALAGVASVFGAVGTSIGLWYGLVEGIPAPSPGLADVFYLLQYPLVAMALVTTGLSYRGLVSVRILAVGATVFSAVSCAVLWFAVLGPALASSGVLPVEAFMSAYYPLADVAAGITPALFVLAVVSQVGGSAERLPWSAVAAGIFVLSMGDLAFWVGVIQGATTVSASVGTAWIIGRVFIGFGALVAADLIRANH